MGEDGASVWTGRREPNTTVAWVIIAIGTGLMVIALYQVMFLDASLNIWFLAMLVVGMVAYAAISFTSSVEMVVDLGEGELHYTKREMSVGQVVRRKTLSVDRSRMAKVVERSAGFGVRVVRIEDAGGRRLLTFPEFLAPEEHDEMIAAIIEWGNQPSSPSPSSGPEDLPLPDSR